MANSTRLTYLGRDQAISELNGLLDNVVKFIETPFNDPIPVSLMWNSMFPKPYVEALKALHKYQVEFRYGSVYTGGIGFGFDAPDRKTYFVKVNMTYMKITGLSELMEAATGLPSVLTLNSRVSEEMRLHKVKRLSGSAIALHVPVETMVEYLGQHKCDEVIQWARDTAVLYDELKSAQKVVKDVFTMAKTAGQVKRMVPELLQYLPLAQRQAFEEQKRSSTLPFEWAAYPKDAVDKMTITVSKGHLLANMGKTSSNEHTVDELDNITWSRHGEWAD